MKKFLTCLKKVNLSEIPGMTTETIRKKLHDYIADADDKKVRGMYLLLEDEINKKEAFQLKNEHFKILDEERQKHLSGNSNSYTWEDARQIIRSKKRGM
jgi:hypothetical protein